MRRFVLGFVLMLAAVAPLSAQTLSTRDIIELTKAGLGEEVLLALIDVHRPVFPIDPDTLKMLKDAGVRQSVIVAMVKSGREVPPFEPPQDAEQLMTRSAPPPQVVVVDHGYQEERRMREVAVPVAVPVYVPVHMRWSQHLQPYHVQPHVQPQHFQPVSRAEPVYWGFGGQLRPDAWKPSDPPHKPWNPGDGPQKK